VGLYKTVCVKIDGPFRTVDELELHDLRHTFGSRLARLGVARANIQKVAGHASITATERYTHTSSTDTALAVGQAVNGSIREVSNRGVRARQTRV
jgi:integrase